VDNVFVRGRGLPIHGVFMRDDNLDLPFDKVSIRHNLVVGAGFRGISVIGATNVEVVDNVVAPFNDRRSYISLENVRGATVKHNRSGLFKYKTSSDIVENDNQVQAVVTDGGVGLVRAWETGLGPDDRAGMTRTGEALPVRPSSAPRA
jgi:hypothetical protein